MKFYSETLNKMFDSPEALQAEEVRVKKAAQEKERAAKNKKAEAQVVEDAFKARNAARATYNQELLAARKHYAEELKKLRTALDTTIDTAAKKLDEAEVAYDKALKDFTAKHPEGYHMTLKDGDNIITLHRDNKETNYNQAFKIFDLMDTFFGI